jgi:hypothetical protein
MSEDATTDFSALSSSAMQRVDAIAWRFERAWKAIPTTHNSPPIEQYVGTASLPGSGALLRELILLDVHYRRRRGEQPRPEDYASRFPTLSQSWLQGAVARRALTLFNGSGPNRAAMSAASPQDAAQVEQPQRFGRYRVERLLGKGGFGTVYLAHDEQLSRLVAIKVPHPYLVHDVANSEVYLAHARIVARLDDPNIAPVYDAGSTDQLPCYIVASVSLFSGDFSTDENTLAGSRGPGSWTDPAVHPDSARGCNGSGSMYSICRDLPPASMAGQPGRSL